jgi:Ni/Fe-hydrogenase subunit HybB-like protein
VSTASPTGDAPFEVKDGLLPRKPWVEGNHTFGTVTDKISGIVERPMPAWWWPMFLFSGMLTLGGVFAATYLISTGVGVWGENNAVNWAFDITNFVFWIGIGHAGTLISAILFLFRQKWRTAINRFSEAMTIFAVICAGVYPGIHVGRIWYVWFMGPIPNPNHIFPQFRSPLLWDVFAVSTYFTVSLLFWYMGLIPDLAGLRDRAKTRFQRLIYGLMSFGWRGQNDHWRHYEMGYLILAGISTPLVLSVHSVVSFDFAVSVLPGWHTTIFPPYFVAGAIFGGFACVLQVMIPVRYFFRLEEFVTTRHMDVMAKFILATGTMVGYAYAMEFFIAWYSGNQFETYTFINRAFGPYWWSYWAMVTCNLFIPQLLWMRSWRQTPWKLFLVSVFVNVGMWFERFVIIVTSLHRKFLPANWDTFYPTWVDWLQMIGDFGLFFTLTLLFIRFLPMMAIAELKGVMPAADPHHGRGHGHSSHGDSGLYDIAPVSNGKQAAVASGTVTPYALLAKFTTTGAALEAAEQVRAAGYTKVDAYTPFAVHHMDRALGQRRSRLPWISLIGGLSGVTTAFVMQEYFSKYDYPIIIGGKFFGSFEPFVPIMFELTVLFTAFFTVGGFLVLCGLPKFYHPLFRSEMFQRVTDDRFFLAVEASDPKFDTQATTALLERLGAARVEIVEA